MFISGFSSSFFSTCISTFTFCGRTMASIYAANINEAISPAVVMQAKYQLSSVVHIRYAITQNNTAMARAFIKAAPIFEIFIFLFIPYIYII